jgi:peptide/nickel transport system substrate-binding protein
LRARSTTSALAAAALACALVLAGCTGGPGNDSGLTPPKGVKGGTLRIVAASDVDSLDPAVADSTGAWALMRLYARTLYSWDSAAAGDAAGQPVPDLAAAPPGVSDDQLTWTFKLRRGVRFAQPWNRQVAADDFVYAVERQIDGRSPVNPYIWLIAGTRKFAGGKAKSIAGLTAPDGWTIRIKLVRPVPELRSILALPWFSPVPRAYGSRSSVGDGYARRLVGSGPYTLQGWAPGRSITLVRNENWDPATDPLRKAWVDRVEVTMGFDQVKAQRAIEQHSADLSGEDLPPPNGDLQRLATDRRLVAQFGVKPTNCQRQLLVDTTSGPTANVKVRQALEYAVDRQALIDALGGQFAGDPATTVLPPSVTGHTSFDLYPSVGNHGDVDKARALLTEAGYPRGLTLTYAGQSDGQGPAVTDALRAGLARAGIKLTVKAWPGRERYEKSLWLTAKKSEHQLADGETCADWPGDAARSLIAAHLDGRAVTADTNPNPGGYDSPAVARLVDQAQADPNPDRRAGLWGQADRQAMADAAVIPLVNERRAFFWSYRVQNWTYSPWVAGPDYANLWLDPYTP